MEFVIYKGMGKIGTILNMASIMRRGENIGDAAVLKLTLLNKHEGEGYNRQLALEQESLNFSQIHLKDLKIMAKESFGLAYYEFMMRNKLKPLNFSDKVRPLFSRYPVSIRYIRLHDMFHTLLGFEADIAGEFGVYSFIGKQNYIPSLNKAARWAHLGGHFFFWRDSSVKKAQAEGLRLAATASNIISEPLEDMLSLPLREVREKLGLKVSNPC